MVSLSDLQVASLLEEIAASMRAGIALPESMRRLQDRRLGRIAAAARQIADGLEQGNSISDSLAHTLPKHYRPAVAAVETATRTGDPGMVTSMARLLTRRSDIKRDTRFAWFYPAVLVFVGFLVGAGVMAPVVVGQQGRDLIWPEPVYATAVWVTQNMGLVFLVFLFVALAGLVIIATRRKFSKPTQRELFCQSLADQISHDVPESVAIHSAAEMAAEPTIKTLTDPTLSSPEVKRIISVEGPEEFEGDGLNQDKQLLIAKLRYLASIHHEQARRHSVFWSRLLPRFAMVAVGCAMIFTYAWFVIAPVYWEVATW